MRPYKDVAAILKGVYLDVECEMVPLFALSRPLRSLIAVTGGSAYEKLIGGTALDALFYLPKDVVIWEVADRLTPALHHHMLVFQARIVGYHHDDARLATRRTPFVIKAEYFPFVPEKDGNTPPSAVPIKLQEIQLVFFYGAISPLKHMFPIGRTLVLRGPLKVSRLSYSCLHPAKGPPPIATPALSEASTAPVRPYGFEPIYPLSRTTQAAPVRRIIEAALKQTPDLPEWIPAARLACNRWPGWKEALVAVHHPCAPKDLTLVSPAKQRLVFDELLAHQVRQEWKRIHDTTSAPILPIPKAFDSWIASLPFCLTETQNRAIREIQADLGRAKPMRRLLQGDVGSGKTLVALAAALQAIEAGFQVAFLAPTDVLARQHFETIRKMLPNIPATLYTAQETGKIRTALLKDTKEGRIHLLVGTHALIQKGVEFARLGLALIDEQHRFGVEQRLRLSTKNKEGLHMLSLSATPIPRTLLLSLYGDVEVSTLTNKPAHQKTVQTRTISLARVKEVECSLKRPIAKGQQVYWVCPLIKDSEALNLVTVETRFESLQRLYPGQVGLLHGQLSTEEKQRVMDDFYVGKISVLVATTVIEIGVDAPNATVMVIENAERFGLAQLHQLRGRVGRGEKESSCLLLYGPELTDVAKKRLNLIRECSDGFKIAEADLALRGGGDAFGTQQSGRTGLRLLPKVAMGGEEMEIYVRLLAEATKLAKSWVSEELEKEKSSADMPGPPAWTVLLKIFKKFEKEEERKNFEG